MARSCPRATDCRRSSIDGRDADQTSPSAPFRFSVSRSISAPLWRTAPLSGSQRLELAVELDSRRIRPERYAAARHRTSRIALNHGHLGNVAGDDAARRDDGAPPDRDSGHDQRPWTDPRLVLDPDRVSPPADDLRGHIVEVGDDHAANAEVRILADRDQFGGHGLDHHIGPDEGPLPHLDAAPAVQANPGAGAARQKHGQKLQQADLQAVERSHLPTPAGAWPSTRPVT